MESLPAGMVASALQSGIDYLTKQDRNLRELPSILSEVGCLPSEVEHRRVRERHHRLRSISHHDLSTPASSYK